MQHGRSATVPRVRCAHCVCSAARCSCARQPAVQQEVRKRAALGSAPRDAEGGEEGAMQHGRSAILLVLPLDAV